MKMQLETIQYSKATRSFHYFRNETSAYRSYWHYHPEIELTFIERGQGIRFVGDHIDSFKSGDLVLLGENIPHDYVSMPDEPKESSIAHVYQFPKASFQQIPEAKYLSALFKRAEYGLLFKKPAESIIQKILETSTASPLKKYILLIGILIELAEDQHIQQLSSTSFAGKSHHHMHQSGISNVTKYIMEHYHSQISLNHIAAYVGMAPPSFCRWFKQSTGSTFVSYLNAARIEKACQLLIQSDDRISNIAFKTGFETISHFNRVFKNIKGCSPKVYRNQQRRMNLGSKREGLKKKLAPRN